MPFSNRRIAAMAPARQAVASGARTGRIGGVLLACAAVAWLSGCQRTPAPNPHYVVGQPYQSGGIWWYPRQSYDLNETGLAAVYPDDHPPLTADGEVFSQGALTAAHATLQLPAIARLTDLETGRSVLVRINDRGTPTPARLVQVTRRVAGLLGMSAGGVAQVRLTVLPGPSQAAEQRVPGAPALAIAAAPRGDVASASLPPPPGARQESGHVAPAPAVRPQAGGSLPDHVPEIVTQGPPQPGRLWVRLDSFQSYQYAAVERARLAGLSPRIESAFEGRDESFQVMLGPFGSVAAADAAVEQAVRAGIVDARVVVE